MTKTRTKKTLSNLPTPMPTGFFTDMPGDCIQTISLASSINDAAALMQTNKRHHALLRQITTKRYLQSMAVIDIKRVNNDMFCLTQGGYVFARGSNWNGALGLGDTEQRKQFEKIPGLADIKQVQSCGYDTTLFIAKSGDVYASGGMHNDSYQGYPQFFIPPSSIPKKVALGKKKIAKVVGSDDDSFFLTDNGEVYTVGDYRWAMLGLGNISRSPRIPVLIRGMPVVRDMGYTGSELYLLAAEGVYACGDNDYGQLGLGDRVKRYSPARVPQLADIKSLVLFRARVYALTNQGQVYAWGDNDDDELGFGDQQEHNSPALLPGLVNIVSMKIGDNCFFITAEGDVCVFGDNRDGELGLGDRVARRTPVLNPTLHHIKNVFCRGRTAFFTTDDNQFYICGAISYRYQLQAECGPQLITNHPIHDHVEQVMPDPMKHKRTWWRTHDGVIYAAGRQWLGQYEFGSYYDDMPEVTCWFPSVSRILKESSIVDLLFYSQGEGGYARYCYQKAFKRIQKATTARQLVNLLQEFNTPVWDNRSEIKTILPAYHLILRYANDRANQQSAWAVMSAWSKLLIMYREMAHARPNDLRRLRDFMEVLTQVSFPQNSVTLFQPPLAARKANRELLADLQADPAALRIAARFLVAELPPSPPLSDLKRKAEDELEPEREAKKFKK
jgi:alpha-tubulin suppressor-like RCC1 family protein